MNDQIGWIIFSLPSILIASGIHEYAHAWAAYRQGDLTAKLSGRMTINPLAHIDIVGTLMMVLARFGWSKPVPINEQNFKNPVLGTALTALAGPVSNLVTAVIFTILLKIFTILVPPWVNLYVQDTIMVATIAFILVNLSLFVFNMIPIPPLDGHKIVRALLPAKARMQWENLAQYGPWLLVLLLTPISPLAWLITGVMTVLVNAILWILTL